MGLHSDSSEDEADPMEDRPSYEGSEDEDPARSNTSAPLRRRTPLPDPIALATGDITGALALCKRAVDLSHQRMTLPPTSSP